MITHLFYHSEAVDEKCAINSWNSIKSCFNEEDEVIILDIGNSLTTSLPKLNITPKFMRYERIRTDTAEERSYTFGLNTMMPLSRGNWIILWRSDYIYHKDYLSNIIDKVTEAIDLTIVLPYECLIGKSYCSSAWSRKHFDLLTTGDVDSIIKHSIVCPVYETQDQPHFAIKKELWIASGGMNNIFYGYGIQFPEFLNRIQKEKLYNAAVIQDLTAFHQNHLMSFSTGVLSKKQKLEARDSAERVYNYFGGAEKYQEYMCSIRQQPIYQRRDKSLYIVSPIKRGIINTFKKLIKCMR